MDINQILEQCQIEYSSFKKVQGGNDSSVYQVTGLDGSNFALRILPLNRLSQFQWEAELISMVREQNIPAPEVISVHAAGGYAVMLMEWVTGQTMLQALMDHPVKARQLGSEFGRVQALIHQIELPKPIVSSWLTPATDIERELFNQINPTGQWLLHMDYHPLNVLTDGEKVTGVIDWINASVGDRRFDMMRTLSIMQIDGPTITEIQEILSDFLEGYRAGYEKIDDPLQHNHLFRFWAGNRMKRDLGQRLDENAIKRIDNWMGQNNE
ncbi:phosphotransferase family protein [Chungangia koreensis]|uniref:Phosphotransferase family protein n=1 Tax=Chungangia koreensis TaxID=752657 RepID=A0ABV8X326_9LACT